MTTEPTATALSAADSFTDIVATAGRYYRNTRYVMFVLLVGMGIWFGYDGFVNWPAVNVKVRALKDQQHRAELAGDQDRIGQLNAELKTLTERTDTDIMLQKVLACALPLLGLVVLARAIHNSRGEYRLSGTKLSVPGHPTIDLDDIKSVNNDLWDRKGIVWLKYETAAGAAGGVMAGESRLDDFVYDRPPTDAIYDQIAKKFGLEEVDAEDADVDDDSIDADERR